MVCPAQNAGRIQIDLNWIRGKIGQVDCFAICGPLYYAHTYTHRRAQVQFLYDQNAPKKPTNLSINSDLLAKSRKLDINLSATLEQALRQKLAEESAESWKQENATAIKAYNSFVEENGVFGEEFRTF